MSCQHLFSNGSRKKVLCTVLGGFLQLLWKVELFQRKISEKLYLLRRRPTLSRHPHLLCACLRLWLLSFSALSSQPGPSSGAQPSPLPAGRGWLPSPQPGKGAYDASLDAAVTHTPPPCNENGRKGQRVGFIPSDRTRSWKMCSQPSLPGLFRPLRIPLKSTVFLTIAPVIIHQEKEKNLRSWGPN